MPKTKRDVARLMVELFRGREGSYAVKKLIDDKKIFLPDRDAEGNDKPFTEEACIRHIDGEISIGCYPLDHNDNVRWASFDFDGKKGDPLVDAIVVRNNLQKAGLRSWLERSQSGKGMHVWVFFEDSLPAATVRRVLGDCVPEFFIQEIDRKTSYDRMFPNQDKAFDKYGNLCAIPLNGPSLVDKGFTAFIDDSGNPLPNQSDVLENAFKSRNKVLPLIEAFRKLPKTQIKKISTDTPKVSGGYKILSQYGCSWLKKLYANQQSVTEPEWYAALGQFARVDQGRAISHQFSKNHPSYDPDNTDAKFDHASKNPAKKIDTIRKEFNNPCGDMCACTALGLQYPWEVAKVPLHRLEVTKRGKVYTSSELSKTAMAIVEEIGQGNRTGYPWGYDILDNATEIRPKNLVIVAARRSVGKTAFMVDVSTIDAEKGIPQYIFSAEMSHEEIAIRYLSRLSGVDHTLITTGQLTDVSWKKVQTASKRLEELPIFLDDTTTEPEQMLDVCGELTYQNGTGMMWLDYLQYLPKKTGESDKQGIDRSVRALKQTSKILEVPVIALAQLNRTEETSESVEDLDSFLKGSGDIEQTADVIIYIRGRLLPGLVVRRVRLHKDRHRASGINFKFDLDQSVFRFYPEGHWDDGEDTEFGTVQQGEEQQDVFNSHR